MQIRKPTMMATRMFDEYLRTFRDLLYAIMVARKRLNRGNLFLFQSISAEMTNHVRRFTPHADIKAVRMLVRYFAATHTKSLVNGFKSNSNPKDTIHPLGAPRY